MSSSASNVFEHIARIDALIAECARVLRPDGVVIVAVPPVTTAGGVESDMQYRWHVHHIPPWAWAAKLWRWFASVETFGHLPVGRGHDRSDPDVREVDFHFPPLPADGLGESITALFVCREPRDVALPETLAEREPAEWCMGAEAQDEAKRFIARLPWRVSAPIRWVRRLVATW